MLAFGRTLIYVVEIEIDIPPQPGPVRMISIQYVGTELQATFHHSSWAKQHHLQQYTNKTLKQLAEMTSSNSYCFWFLLMRLPHFLADQHAYHSQHHLIICDILVMSNTHLYCIIRCISLNNVEAGINLDVSIRRYQYLVHWSIFLQQQNTCSVVLITSQPQSSTMSIIYCQHYQSS